jgi:replicative DNA helicase
MLNAYLDALAQTEDFRPDLILLDYLTLMHIDGRDIRVSIGQLARNLRGLAALRNCAVVTAVQAHRRAVGRRWVSASHVAEDWSLVGTCDTFLTYSQTSFERDKKVARILVDKARNSADKWAAFVAQAYEIGQFALDSCYHSQLKDQLGDNEDE